MGDFAGDCDVGGFTECRFLDFFRDLKMGAFSGT